jgi:hypothetical protein
MEDDTNLKKAIHKKTRPIFRERAFTSLDSV